eukprot:6214340-Pleurochrysis_carterae.AAC.3
MLGTVVRMWGREGSKTSSAMHMITLDYRMLSRQPHPPHAAPPSIALDAQTGHTRSLSLA